MEETDAQDLFRKHVPVSAACLVLKLEPERLDDLPPDSLMHVISDHSRRHPDHLVYLAKYNGGGPREQQERNRQGGRGRENKTGNNVEISLLALNPESI